MSTTAKFGGALIVAILIIIGLIYAFSFDYAESGTVKVLTKYGAPKQVYTPNDGRFSTWGWGIDAIEVGVKSFTVAGTARVTSKDNAALQVEVSVSGRTNPTHILTYIDRFGLSEEDRHKRRDEIITRQIQTETRNAFVEHNAYDIYASQEAIQKRIFDALKPQLEEQLYILLESVQIGNPDFLDDRIEQAASAVIAARKQEEAETAWLAAAKKQAERKVVEAQTLANPQLFTIRKMEIEYEIAKIQAEGIARHNGPLTIVYGGSRAGVNLQVPTGGQQ